MGVVRWFNALWCAHEWTRRVDGRRVYLECIHCLATSPGLNPDEDLPHA